MLHSCWSPARAMPPPLLLRLLAGLLVVPAAAVNYTQKLADHKGESFFENYNFFSGEDPTQCVASPSGCRARWNPSCTHRSPIIIIRPSALTCTLRQSPPWTSLTCVPSGAAVLCSS